MNNEAELVAALNTVASGGDDEIAFASDIMLTRPLPFILFEEPFTIEGNGFTLDADRQSRALTIITGVEVAIRNLTIANGFALGGFGSDGGGGGAGIGGGLFFLGYLGGSLALEGVTFQGNEAQGGDGGEGSGGGGGGFGSARGGFGSFGGGGGG
ncbi:MAG: hypothetical protein AAGH19_09650, partial [Pseudomonadota bacterium]